MYMCVFVDSLLILIKEFYVSSYTFFSIVFYLSEVGTLFFVIIIVFVYDSKQIRSKFEILFNSEFRRSLIGLFNRPKTNIMYIYRMNV